MDDTQPAPGKVRIDLNGEFSAIDLEEIIQLLMVERAAMQPEVTMQAPSEDAPDAMVTNEPAESFAIRILLDGSLRFWLRSAGIGWMSFDLPARHREPLARYLLSNQFTNRRMFH